MHFYIMNVSFTNQNIYECCIHMKGFHTSSTWSSPLLPLSHPEIDMTFTTESRVDIHTAFCAYSIFISHHINRVKSSDY